MRTSRSPRRQPALPAELTSFIGRRRELAAVKQLLAGSRLVTLTGSGGVGKTRLALRSASELARAFSDGARLAELAALEDPSLVASAVASALGLRDESARWLPATLSDYLSDKRLLLVLDNCEHLLSATAILADTLLRAAPGLVILATSREPLGITGEANFAVPCLSLPLEGDLPAVERLTQYEAVTLLAERARDIVPNFQLTADNRDRVVEVCRRLDGIPLAIELATVRLRALSLDELVTRLDDEFRVLTQGSRTALPRQQTLQATIQWSWNLLGERERVLLRRLSVFVGGCEIDAIEAVCSDDQLPRESIFDALAGLIDKSIVSRTETLGRTRYGMLETLRQFAREKARGSGEVELLATRHLAWQASLCESARSAMNGSDRHQWLDRLEADFANLQVAFERAQLTEEDAETGIRMITSLLLVWQTGRHQREGRQWLAALLARATSPTATRLRGLEVLAWLELILGARDEARRAIASGLSLAKELSDGEGMAGILAAQGLLAAFEGDFTTAISSLRSSEVGYRTRHNKDGLARSLYLLGAAYLMAEDTGRAEPVVTEAISIAIETGNDQDLGHARQVLGWHLLQTNRHPEADVVFKQALAVHAELDRWSLALVFQGLAYLSLKGPHYERAATLMGVVENIWKSARPAVSPKGQRLWSDAGATLRLKLGDEQFQRTCERGRAMNIDDAVAFATRKATSGAATTARPARSTAAAVRQSGLSARELEIASLVARGMSNKEIASKLILSERTIEHHLTHILDKLGFNSRAQVAVWAAAATVPS